ncbi:MAG TPA: hypothetical protein PKE03_05845 [Bacteroidales bacterium]|nr:hypothetical protein [Bacteroidales bacterium]
MKKNILLWITAFLLMALMAIWQRSTGPTYPVRGSIELKGETVKYRLIRSHNTGQDALVEIKVPEGIYANIRYKRFKSYDEWTTLEVMPEDGVLRFAIPEQPAAGKVEYQIALMDQDKAYPLTPDPVVIRFKGPVPGFVLVPHVFFMFFAMVFGMRTGLEVLTGGKKASNLSLYTLLLFLFGGLVLGPIVQKYAFDAYWTGWPWGTDLTDNKTAVSFILWLVAWLVLRKKPENKLWPLAASIVMIAVYLIPHSVLGSEIDHTKTENPATQIEATE